MNVCRRVGAAVTCSTDWWAFSGSRCTVVWQATRISTTLYGGPDDPIGVQPWELPSSVMPAQGGQALVAAERADQAGQDGRPSGAALSSIDLPVVRGVGSSKAVPGSVGSYRPVIAGAKLREGTTTILPRGRALQGAGLSSMRFHPTGEGPEDDKDGQIAWFTARIASLIG